MKFGILNFEIIDRQAKHLKMLTTYGSGCIFINANFVVDYYGSMAG